MIPYLFTSFTDNPSHMNCSRCGTNWVGHRDDHTFRTQPMYLTLPLLDKPGYRRVIGSAFVWEDGGAWSREWLKAPNRHDRAMLKWFDSPWDLVPT